MADVVFNYARLVSGSPALGDAVYFKVGSGDSTDTKPTGDDADDICDGSIITESNTGKVFFFNAKTRDWVEQFSFQG